MEKSIALVQCDSSFKTLSRRGFLRTAAAATALAGVGPGGVVRGGPAARTSVVRVAGQTALRLAHGGAAEAGLLPLGPQRRRAGPAADADLGQLARHRAGDRERILYGRPAAADSRNLPGADPAGLGREPRSANERRRRGLRQAKRGDLRHAGRRKVRIRAQRAAHYRALRRSLRRARRLRRSDRLWPRGQRVPREAGPPQQRLLAAGRGRQQRLQNA